MLQINRSGRALGVTQTIALAEDFRHLGLFPVRRIHKLNCVIVAAGNAGTAGDTVVDVDIADRAGGGDRIPCFCSVWLLANTNFLEH